ncbi:MAG TPA: P-loop NTPase fold protein [Flavipsychrobacter sp.]
MQKSTSKYSLLDDYADPDKYDDSYSRKGYAASIANHINATSSDVSFAIGVIGEWGSGKSDFMLRLKKVLKAGKADNENIVFDFNPWRVNKQDAIIEEFFKTLSKELKPYNQSISNTINDYSSRVLKTAKETHYRLVDTLINSWFKEEDIQEKYDIINDAIKSTSKRVVVFIDDVDRLTGKEVMEVLRLIRNTANFTNTFFVVGIDQKYIIKVLQGTKDFANEEEYLQKVFQLTITLPAFKKDNFISQIKANLFTDDLDETYKKRLNSALSHISVDPTERGAEQWVFPYFHQESLLDKMIDTVRDLKRFCNSFKIAFEILKDEADISDLIVLELIRNKSVLVYNNIRNRNILTRDIGSMSKLILDATKWSELKMEIDEADRSALSDAVEYLFTDASFKNQRKIVLSHNFFIYFSYQIFDLISFKEFNEALELDADEMEKTFRKWISQDKESELSRVIYYIGDFENSNQLQKVVIVLLRLWYPSSNWYELAKQLVYTYAGYNNSRYFNNDGILHKRFLYEIFKDSSIALLTRAWLISEFDKAIRAGQLDETKLSIGKKELANITFHLFDQYLNSNPNNGYDVLSFYALNDFTIVGSAVTHLPHVNRRFRRYLSTNPNGFKDYVKTLLRPSRFPYTGELTMEPYLQDIFGNWQTFEKKLSETDFGDENHDKLKSIILKYLSEYFNSNRTPFKIEAIEDAKFVDEFLNFKRH